MDSFELAHVELLIDQSNLEVNRIRRRQIDLDLVNIEPEQESLNLNTLEIGDGAVTELSSDDLVVIDQVVELDVAGGGQIDDEGAVVVEGVAGDGCRQEARREAVLGEELVDGGGIEGLRKRGFEEGEEDEERKKRELLSHGSYDQKR